MEYLNHLISSICARNKVWDKYLKCFTCIITQNSFKSVVSNHRLRKRKNARQAVLEIEIVPKTYRKRIKDLFAETN